MTALASRRGRPSHGIRTFLIADIRGYTSFTAQRGDEAASRLASKFAEIAAEGIEGWGGELVELRGDEALGVFDSPRAALRAAAELQAAFVAESESDPSLRLPVGMGLDAGEAVLVGDGYRGAALNMAARLCAVAGPGVIHASQGLVNLAGPTDGLSYTALEPTVPKGMTGPISIIQVTWDEQPGRLDVARWSAGPATVQALPPELEPLVPLAGRNDELRWLRWHWRRAGHGNGRTVVLSGPPGIGKTRLSAELATMAHREGGMVHYLPSGLGADPKEIDGRNGGAPALIIVDDLDAAPSLLVEGVMALSKDSAHTRLLLVTHREEAGAALQEVVERLTPLERRLTLGSLDAEAVRAIAALYAGRAIEDLPISRLAQESGGVPAAVHRVAASWARSSATRRLSASADRTAAGRQGLRAAEDDLIGDVSDLELARERSRLYGAESDDPSAGQAALTVCPYKGLAAFEAADADYFFGRERLVAELVARLVGSSFLGLVGASGSGKSSTLRAGLLPAIAGGVLPGSEKWIQVLLRPGEHPLDELAQALGRATPQDTPAASDAHGGLETALARLDGGQLLLVVDQFEEVFGATRDDRERDAFVELLTAQRPGLRVIVTLRADHYGHCAAYPALAKALGASHALIGPMTSPQLVAVIEHPAERVGLRVEPGLTDALVADAGTEPGVLPLLSTSLLELWQARDVGRLSLAAYRASGGLRGAVARLAEAAYAELNPGQQQVARSILLRLAGPGEGEGMVRRRVPRDELDADRDAVVAEVLDTLTSARLLTSGDGYVEVAHEALLREWPRLQTWLEEDAAGRTLRLHLMGAVRDWEQRGREAGDLYRGARLATALDWASEHQIELNRAEREFLEESRLASERDVEHQRRTNRRLRGLLAGAAVFLIVAVGAGAFAAIQLGRAEEEGARAEQNAAQAVQEGDRAAEAAAQAEQERGRAEEQAELARQEAEAAQAAQVLARSRELTASALSVLGDDPSLSKLLAVASASVLAPDLAAESVLHQVWAADPIIDRYTWPDEAVVPDLDPSGRFIAAIRLLPEAGTALQVVDWRTDEVLWDFTPDQAGAFVGDPYFTVDGERLVAGVWWDPGPGETSVGPMPDAMGIHVWETETGRLLDRFDVGRCGGGVNMVSATAALVTTVPESETSNACFSDFGMSRFELLDLASGERELLAAETYGDAKLSRDGRFAAMTEVTDTAVSFVVDLSTGERILEIDPATTDQRDHYVRGLSSDGSLLLYGDRPLQVWDIGAGEVMASLGGDSGETSSFVGYGPAGFDVYAVGRDATLRRFDARTGVETFALPAAGGDKPSISESGLVLAMDEETRTAAIVDPRVRGEVGTVRTCDGPTFAGTLNVVNGTAVFYSVCDGTVEDRGPTFVVDLTSREIISSTPDATGQTMVMSPDGSSFALQEISPDDSISPLRVRDAGTGDLVVEVAGLCSYDAALLPETPPGCNAFPEPPFPLLHGRLRWSPDGTMLAANDGIGPGIAVWDAGTGALLHTEPAPEGGYFVDHIFTPDSQRLITYVSAGEGRELLALSTENWEITLRAGLDIQDDGTETIGFAGFLADGSTLVGVGGWLGNGGGWLHRIDSETLQILSTNAAHDGSPKTMAVSPDGSLVATGASDGLVRVWDGPRGTLLHQIPIQGEVQGVAFINDTHLAVTPASGNLLIVTFDSQELVDIVRASLTRGFTDGECERFDLDPCPTLEEMQAGATATIPHRQPSP